jgi:hypothetical protein
MRRQQLKTYLLRIPDLIFMFLASNLNIGALFFHSEIILEVSSLRTLLLAGRRGIEMGQGPHFGPCGTSNFR